MIPLKEYIKNLQEIVKENPEFGNLPIVCAEDIEGNGYYLSEMLATPAQFHNLEDTDLKLVGFLKGTETPVDKKDVNAIIIN